jgi:hypothetical protein
MRKHRIGGNQRVKWKFQTKNIQHYGLSVRHPHIVVFPKFEKKVIMRSSNKKQV